MTAAASFSQSFRYSFIELSALTGPIFFPLFPFLAILSGEKEKISIAANEINLENTEIY